ncbi:MAG TPA: ankyrin repeat domain-containing protein, partial [Candidatus Babeliales bacterium]|nr:ankyrin repeat domain-containing protein [Candidatus Babeliales bacterium]
IVEQLLAVPGIEVNHADINGDTALIKATRNGRAAIVAQLLAVPGIEVNHASRYGNTALTRAFKFGHTAITEQLLLADAVVPDALAANSTLQRIRAELATRTANFIAAATNGQLATMHQLLAQGLSRKILNLALIAAAGSDLELADYVAVLQLLLAQGAEINAVIATIGTSDPATAGVAESKADGAAATAVVTTVGVTESKMDDTIADTTTIMPQTILETAILRNIPELVQTLLDLGAEPNLSQAVSGYLAQFTPRSDQLAVAQAQIMIAATKAGWEATAAAQAIEIANLIREAQVKRGDPSALHAMQQSKR